LNLGDRKMFVSTAGRTNEEMIATAQAVADELQIPYISRNKRSVSYLQEHYKSSCIIVGKERLELFLYREVEPFFFHPNSAMFRMKRLQRGEHDPFVDACKLEKGMSFLDCTLGLASDSIVASYIVGTSGEVIALESEKYLSYIVKRGLKNWTSGQPNFDEAMRRIDVRHIHSYELLRAMANNSIDCVYFDPMFEEKILESDGIQALSQLANYEEFQPEWIDEALRVAKKRVVLKDHYLSQRFKQFGFQVIKRKTAKFHFGFIEKEY
jgi:hypothetical protein